jgi:hypothetical protein
MFHCEVKLLLDTNSDTKLIDSKNYDNSCSVFVAVVTKLFSGRIALMKHFKHIRVLWSINFLLKLVVLFSGISLLILLSSMCANSFLTMIFFDYFAAYGRKTHRPIPTLLDQVCLLICIVG